jgi:serine protease AprX
MKFDRALVSMLALVAWSSAALSAPVQPSEGTGLPPTAAAAPDVSAGGQIHAGPAVRRSDIGHPLADSDGDGLSDGLEARLAESPTDTRVEVIVSFSGPGNAASAQSHVGPFEVHHEYRLISAFAATMSGAQARALARVGGVFRIEEDARATVFLEAARRDFGAESVSLNYGFTGAGIDICIVDTGIEVVHEQFVDEATGSSAGKLMAFQDFVGDLYGDLQTEPYDDHGHGTHVASIAAGDGTGSALAPRLRGVAPDALLHIAKVLDGNGSGPVSGIIAALDWCILQGVDVINMSLGLPGSSDGRDSLSKAANEAVNTGVVVVVAAGNGGDGPATVGSPGAADQVITVGATAEWSADPLDPNESFWHTAGVYPAPFSSRGPTKDGDVKPDIMGPGVSIAAALADPFGIYAALNGCNNDCYTTLSGTSMASPFVAGVVALLLEADGGLSPAAVAQALYVTAQDRGTVAGKDNDTGFGLVDAYTALEQVQLGGVYTPTLFPALTLGTDTVPDGGEVWIPIEVTDTSAPLAVTITIDGQFECFLRLGRSCLSAGWSPDLEAQLFDFNMNPFEEPNPLYPILDPNPMVARLGTLSTCPAGSDCGTAGQQETIYFSPPTLGTYWLKVFSFDGDPNFGAGGAFTYEISQGPAVPPTVQLSANAGQDQNVTDADKDGAEMVTLDGGGSSGPVDGYSWSEGGVEFSTAATVSQVFTVGTHDITLTVDDGNGEWASDTVTVTVKDKKGGGGSGGGGGGGPRPRGGNTGS